MLDETRFNEILDNALAARRRYFGFCQEEQVCFVASFDVLEAMAVRATGYYETGRTNIRFSGTRVFAISDGAIKEYLQPAVIGRNYFDGMVAGDNIVDEGMLYTLRTNNEMATFVSTGINVITGEEYFMAMSAALSGALAPEVSYTLSNAESAVMMNVANDLVTNYTVTYPTNTILTNMSATTTASSPNIMDTMDKFAYTLWGRVNGAQKHRNRNKGRQDELSIGDTRQLDEFLGSFRIKDTSAEPGA